MEHHNKKATAVLFSFYCAAVLWLLFARQPNPAGVPFWVYARAHLNLRPFRTIRLFARLFVPPVLEFLVRIAIHNLLGNLVLFVPMGIFLPTLFKPLESFPRTVISVTLMVAIVELMQLLMMVGTCDVDDLLLNVLGAALGYGIYTVSRWIASLKF